MRRVAAAQSTTVDARRQRSSSVCHTSWRNRPVPDGERFSTPLRRLFAEQRPPVGPLQHRCVCATSSTAAGSEVIGQFDTVLVSLLAGPKALRRCRKLPIDFTVVAADRPLGGRPPATGIQPRQLLHPLLAGQAPAHPSGVHPQGRLLAQPAGSLVAVVSPAGVRRADPDVRQGGHPGDRGRHRAAQRPCPAVGVGPPSALATPPTPRVHISIFRKAALGRAAAGRPASRPERRAPWPSGR